MATRERLQLQARYDHVANRAMRDLLERGEAVDVSSLERTDAGHYLIPPHIWQEDIDWCNAVADDWIRSIGRHRATGRIVASHGTELYQHPDYECIWLR